MSDTKTDHPAQTEQTARQAKTDAVALTGLRAMDAAIKQGRTDFPHGFDLHERADRLEYHAAKVNAPPKEGFKRIRRFGRDPFGGWREEAAQTGYTRKGKED